MNIDHLHVVLKLFQGRIGNNAPLPFTPGRRGVIPFSPVPLLKEPEKNVTLYYHAECSINQMINGYI